VTGSDRKAKVDAKPKARPNPAEVGVADGTADSAATVTAPVTIGRWVSGVVGLMSAAATIYGLFTDKRIIVFALLGMVCAIILLLVVSRASKQVGRRRSAFFDAVVYVLVTFVVGYFMWLMVMLGPSLVRALTSSDGSPAPTSSVLPRETSHDAGSANPTPVATAVTATSTALSPPTPHASDGVPPGSSPASSANVRPPLPSSRPLAPSGQTGDPCQQQMLAYQMVQDDCAKPCKSPNYSVEDIPRCRECEAKEKELTICQRNHR
jgi:hypothetical protein